jgi:hypothetical protein
MSIYTWNYTGGQAYNFSEDYGAKEILNNLPEWLDEVAMHRGRKAYFWNVHSDKDLRDFMNAITSKCPEINIEGWDNGIGYTNKRRGKNHYEYESTS